VLFAFALCACAPCAPCAAQVLFVTKNRSLADLPEEMSDYYVKAQRKSELPVQRVRDDVGLQPQQIMHGLGLVRGAARSLEIPDELDELLCTLNRRRCLRVGGESRWTNRKGDSLCLPDVTWSDTAAFAKVVRFHKSVDHLEQMYGSCTAFASSASAEPCADGLRRIAGKTWDASKSRTLLFGKILSFYRT